MTRAVSDEGSAAGALTLPHDGIDADEAIELVPPERQVADLELPDWQNGYWPSSKNVTQ
jgi:hypothetical protein